MAARSIFRFIELGERLLHAVVVLPLRWPASWMEALLRGHDRRKERRVFDQMTDYMLKDIGLSRCDLYDDLGRRHGGRDPGQGGR
jgi:uncharacterized protein YjiS (DUF1127 family)